MQIVGYETAIREQGPSLLLAADGNVTRQSLKPGVKLTYQLTKRHCAGAVDQDGHHACSREVAPYCSYHTDTWACARCRGQCTKPLANCEKPHALYLAAFAPATFKVGVTKQSRVTDRLREQGADRAAYLEQFPDGRLARRREAALAERIGDRVRVTEKIEGLHKTVDTDAWAQRIAAFEPINTYELTYGIALDHAPLATTRATGHVRGVKGRVLLLQVEQTTYAVDLRALVGYEVTHTTTAQKQDRQASLSGFS